MTVSARRLFYGLLLLAVIKGCSSTPEPWYRQQLQEFTATVTAMEHEQRLLSLQDESGRAATIHVGPEVRNYDQIKVGDRVVVTYHEALAAAVTRPDQAVQKAQVDASARRSEPGQKPYAEIAASMVATVKIDAIDTAVSTITFTREDGFVRTVHVQDPGAKQFIKGLKQGDLVTVTYTEALAISVREATAL
jgi:translation initiation factor IF-1